MGQDDSVSTVQACQALCKQQPSCNLVNFNAADRACV
jgi:hypothetical protein